MSESELKALEGAAQDAERRLAALELKVAGGSGAAAGVDVQRYISELQSLKGILIAAKTDQDALEKRVVELETANTKLQYQITHLKRAVQDGDEKLAKLTSS